MARLIVEDLMTAAVKTIAPGDSVADLLGLLHGQNIRHVPVVEGEGELVGLVTHRDVLRNTLSGQVEMPLSVREEMLTGRRVDTIMTTDVITVGPQDPLSDAAELMLENKLGCVPVVEGNHLCGILTESDFVRHIADSA